MFEDSREALQDALLMWCIFWCKHERRDLLLRIRKKFCFNRSLLTYQSKIFDAQILNFIFEM